MTSIEIRADLAEQLSRLADDQDKSIDDVIESLLEGSMYQTGDTLRQIADHLPSVFFLTDLHRTKTYFISPAAERVLGISLERAYASPRNFLDVVHPYDRPWLEANFYQPAQDQVVQMEYRINHPDGSVHWIASKVFPVRSEAGEFDRVVGISEDITERKHLEQALKAARARLSNILEFSAEAIIAIDSSQNTFLYNQSAEDIFGYSAEEMIGQPLDRLLPERYIELHREHIQRFTHSDDTSRRLNEHGEIHGRRRDGSEFPALASISKFEHDGELILTVFLQDISEQKAAEAHSLLYEEAVEATYDQIAVIGSDFRYLLANRVYLEYNQMDLQDMIGHTVAEVLGKDFFLTVAKPHILQCLAGEVQDFETEYDYPDIGKRHLLVNYSPMHDTVGNIVGGIAVIRDITNRKIVENHVRENEQKLKALFEVLPVGVTLLNNERQIIEVNPALEGILDLTLPELLQGKYRNRQYITNDGSLLSLEQLPSTRAVQEQRAIFDVEMGVVKEDGETVWVSVSAAPLPLPDLSVVVVTADISERKQTEQQKLALLLEQERNKILSTFIRDVGHEFKTPLAIMRSDIYLAQRSADDPALTDRLARIDQQIDAIDQLVNNLVTLTRLETVTSYETSDCHLNQILRDALTATMTPDVTAHIETDERLPKFVANEYDLRLALTEIIKNAVHHTPAGGDIYVSSTSAGEQAIVTIRDTGEGMSQEVMGHIFERFYRYDEAHTTRGFGLGLPIVQKIISLHHGDIQVNSVLGKGTTFTIALPLA